MAKNYRFVVKEFEDGRPYIVGEPLSEMAEGGCIIEIDEANMEEATRIASHLSDLPIRYVKSWPRVAEFQNQVKA